MTSWQPEEDRHNHTRQWLEGMLVASFGGRVAEELVFGSAKVTTGAANDIEQATNVARRMVTQFGMSDKVGMMAVGDREQEIFLGREFSQRREISERMSEMVDQEVKRLLDEAYERARDLLSSHRDLMDRMVAALLERETIDREEIDLLFKGKELPPRSAALPPGPAPLPAGGERGALPRPAGVPSPSPSPA
jgi:cell division protease FtsH